MFLINIRKSCAFSQQLLCFYCMAALCTVWWWSLSHVWLSMTSWTDACQAALSMGFPRQEYWSGLPFPFPGDLPDWGIEPEPPTLQADSLTTEPPGKPILLYALVAKLCQILATPWTSPPGSSVHGILQARILEWVAISFSSRCY